MNRRSFLGAAVASAATVFMVKYPLSSDPHPHDEHDFDRHPDE